MAERVGFEPTVEFPLHSLSRRALSTAQTPLRANSGSISLTNAWGAHNTTLASRAPMGILPLHSAGSMSFFVATFLLLRQFYQGSLERGPGRECSEKRLP